MDETTEKQQFLCRAVFGLKNVVLKSLKTDHLDHKVEIGLTDGQRTLVIEVDLNDARFVAQGDTDAA